MIYFSSGTGPEQLRRFLVSHSTPNPETSPAARRIRVAFVITELDPGGAERQLVQLVTNLDRDRFESEAVCLSGEGELAGVLRDAGIRVTSLHAGGRWDAGVLFRLRRHFRRSRPDVVQTFLFHANIAGRLAARRAGVPVVVSGIRVAERRHRWHLWLDRWTDRFVDRHVCVSRDVAEFSTQVGKLPAEKLVVIPNGVEVDRFVAADAADLGEFGFPEDARVILFVGRLDEQKDPQRLVDAFRIMTHEVSDATLLIVGTGPLESALRQSALEFGGRVVLAGQRADVARLMKAASCLALPSRWEGMPNVVLEALAAGLPVVASDVEGVRELLREGTLGTLVEEPGPAPLAAGLVEALKAPDQALAKAREAQVVIFNEYTVGGAVAAYE